MSGIALNEVERRQTARVVSEKSVGQMKHPSLMSKEAEKAYNDARNSLKQAYGETLLMLTTDFNRLLWAFKEVCRKKGLDPGAEFDLAVKENPIPTEVEKLIEIKAAQAAEKAAKAGKDLPGQQKLKNKNGKLDDGSTAEPASEVKTKEAASV